MDKKQRQSTEIYIGKQLTKYCTALLQFLTNRLISKQNQNEKHLAVMSGGSAFEKCMDKNYLLLHRIKELYQIHRLQ
mgnify:CR=1 FL=1